MRILVTGGAGYIGSVITDQLIADNHAVVVYDNLTKGHRESVSQDATLVDGDLLDQDAMEDALRVSPSRKTIRPRRPIPTAKASSRSSAPCTGTPWRTSSDLSRCDISTPRGPRSGVASVTIQRRT
jgi:NAD(P)-dependent dehydrogenase (short-subunit alcohol dehydrogenase family)